MKTWERLDREMEKLNRLRKEEEKLYSDYCRLRHERVVQEEDVHFLWDGLMEKVKSGACT